MEPEGLTVVTRMAAGTPACSARSALVVRTWRYPSCMCLTTWVKGVVAYQSAMPDSDTPMRWLRAMTRLVGAQWVGRSDTVEA